MKTGLKSSSVCSGIFTPVLCAIKSIPSRILEFNLWCHRTLQTHLLRSTKNKGALVSHTLVGHSACGRGPRDRASREEEEEEEGSRDQVTNQTDQHCPCHCSLASGGVVNNAEAAVGETALHTSGLASGSWRCSGSHHVSALLGFRLLKCHSSSVSRTD